jgi:SAM-dependent methyltransferase
VTQSKQTHWNKVYGTKAITAVSWYEARPAKSLELIRATGILPADPIIDIGGGASFLADELQKAGYQDLTVLDLSAEVLQKLRERLGTRGASVNLLHQDVTTFQPTRRYALWHDRAVFHFLVQREDRQRYVESLLKALRPDGHVVIATFGPARPERCSGLPIARYDAPALAAELGGDFELVASSLEIHRTPSGAEQQFLYCRFDRKAP